MGGQEGEVWAGGGAEKQPLCAHGSTERGTVYLLDREGSWKPADTKCSLN